MEEKAVMKTEADGKHPASHYLVVGDPNEVGTWHLRVKNTRGELDHRLMGAAWAALHQGYRGNRYEGPGKQEAIAKLKRYYKEEGMEPPGASAYYPAESKMLFGASMPIGEIKAAGEDWIVEGYVSTFGNIDLGNDVVMPGAFAKSLKENKRVRFLLSHDPRLVLGVPKSLKEDSKGLFGSFKISKTQLGQDTHQLLLDGAIDSFSIGYKAVDWEIVDQEVRQLKAVELYEASLVPMPMNQEALVTSVKDASIADRASYLNLQLVNLYDDLRGLVDGIDKPLSETKREELTELLTLCAGWDAVRSDLQSVLATAPQPKLVATRQAQFELAEARKRLMRKGVIQ